MSLLSALFKRTPPGPPIRCCACKKAIGPAKKVKHAIGVGALYLPFCETCHREVVKRNETLNRTIEGHIRGGQYTRDEKNPFTTSGLQCLRCAQVLARKGSVEKLDEAGAFGLTITVSRPRRHGEQVANLYGMQHTAPVADIFTLCVKCARDYLPGLSPAWVQEAEASKEIRSVHIPM
jgi:hypothetical protein